MQQQDDDEEDDELIDLDMPPFVSSGTARTPAARPPNPVATTLAGAAGRRLRRRKDSPDDILRQAAARWAEAEEQFEVVCAAGGLDPGSAEAVRWLRDTIEQIAAEQHRTI